LRGRNTLEKAACRRERHRGEGSHPAVLHDAELLFRFTFVHKPVANIASARMISDEGNVSDVPLVLVVEDEYPLQGLVEEALREGGFETAILSSGEEALTLFRQGRALSRARYRRQFEGLAERVGSRETDQRNGRGLPGHLHDRCKRRPMDVARRPRQHPPAKTLRAGAVGDGGFAASQRRRADGHLAPVRQRACMRSEHYRERHV